MFDKEKDMIEYRNHKIENFFNSVPKHIPIYTIKEILGL
jgi:hypothetical protein